jgi:hypothetical protein
MSVKVSDLIAVPTNQLEGADLLLVVDTGDVSGGGAGTSRKTTLSDLGKYIRDTYINVFSSTEKGLAPNTSGANTTDYLSAAGTWQPIPSTGEVNLGASLSSGGIDVFTGKTSLTLNFLGLKAADTQNPLTPAITWSNNGNDAVLTLNTNLIDHTKLANKGTASHATIDAHLSANSGVHGLSGEVVGTTDTQTLTGKTIAAGTNTITGLGSANVVPSLITGFVDTAATTADSLLLYSPSAGGLIKRTLGSMLADINILATDPNTISVTKAFKVTQAGVGTGTGLTIDRLGNTAEFYMDIDGNPNLASNGLFKLNGNYYLPKDLPSEVQNESGYATLNNAMLKDAVYSNALPGDVVKMKFNPVVAVYHVAIQLSDWGNNNEVALLPEAHNNLGLIVVTSATLGVTHNGGADPTFGANTGPIIYYQSGGSTEEIIAGFTNQSPGAAPSISSDTVMFGNMTPHATPFGGTPAVVPSTRHNLVGGYDQILFKSNVTGGSAITKIFLTITYYIIPNLT